MKKVWVLHRDYHHLPRVFADKKAALDALHAEMCALWDHARRSYEEGYELSGKAPPHRYEDHPMFLGKMPDDPLKAYERYLRRGHDHMYTLWTLAECEVQ